MARWKPDKPRRHGNAVKISLTDDELMRALRLADGRTLADYFRQAGFDDLGDRKPVRDVELERHLREAATFLVNDDFDACLVSLKAAIALMAGGV
jgi:hypothetical protein